MVKPFLTGDKIFLRALVDSDAEGAYSAWLNDSEVTRYLESGYFPNSVESLKEYIKKYSNTEKAVIFAIIEKSSGRHIGNVKLEPINWIHRTAVMGILLGEKDCYGKGYATETVKLVAEYAFTKLNLRKISLGVVADNKAAVKVYEKAGFQVEGVKKKEAYHYGKYCDIILMALFKEDCKRGE